MLQGRQHWSRRYFGGFVPYAVRSLPLSPPRSAAQGRKAFFEELHASPEALRASLALQTLERYIGWPALQQGLAIYRSRFPEGGGSPEALNAILNEQGGRDLSTLFKSAFAQDTIFDYGVEQASTRPQGDKHKTTVVLRRYGGGTFPVSYDLPILGRHDGSRSVAGRLTVDLA